MKQFTIYTDYAKWRASGDHADIPVRLLGSDCFDWPDRYAAEQAERAEDRASFTQTAPCDCDAQATIARLTAELEAALKEQDRLAKAWEAKHEQEVRASKDHADYFDKSQRRMRELIAERDQALARAAAAAMEMRERAANEACYACGSQDIIRILPLPDTTTALAEIVKREVDAETRACAEAVQPMLRSMLSRGEAYWTILARIYQRKEKGE